MILLPATQTFFLPILIGLASGALGAMFASRRLRPALNQAAASRDNTREGNQRVAEHRDKLSRETRIAISDDEVTVVAAGGRTERARLPDVWRVSAETRLYGGRPFHSLVLRKKIGSVRLPVEALGFEEVLRSLEQLPGFDRVAYGRALTSLKRADVVVYQRELQPNLRIVPRRGAAELREEFAQGFVLNLPGENTPGGDRPGEDVPGGYTPGEQEVLSLDSSVEHFVRYADCTYGQDEVGNNVFRTGPIRFGDLYLDEWIVYLRRGPMNRPMAEVHLEAVLVTGDRTYWELKRYFAGFLGTGTGWERADENSWQWRHAGWMVGIVYWYPPSLGGESGYCSFSVKNVREYPELRVDGYTNSVDLSRVKVLLLPFVAGEMSRDIRGTSWSRRTPAAIRATMQPGSEYVLWQDPANRCFGIAAGADALVVPYGDSPGFKMLNASPARGGGYSSLHVLETGAAASEFGVGAGALAFNQLPPWKEQIEELFGLPIELIETMDD